MDATTAAAASPIAYGTSHRRACAGAPGSSAGETLLVHGAAGGVGLTAVEIGKAMGATVIATAGGAEKLAVARAHGADHVHRLQHARTCATASRRCTDGRGADVVYDPVGGERLRGVAALHGGRRPASWSIGFASGQVPQIPANILLVKNIAAIGFYWGSYAKERPAAMRDAFAELLQWYAAGKLRPHVSHRFTLDEAPAALKLMAARKSTGKIVLMIGG